MNKTLTMNKIQTTLKLSLPILFMSATTITFGSVIGKPKKPNIIVILTDDQGSIDINCYGSKDLVTPNMDRLAKEGTRFTQFYSAASVCSPSRAALLTGKTNLLLPH